MEPRERVQLVLNGGVPDRVPTRLRALPEVRESLEQYMGLKGEALLDKLGVDFVRASFVYSGPGDFRGEGPDFPGKDIFGVERVPVENKYCTYFEIKNSPFANVTSVSEIEGYPWPSADWFDYESLSNQIDSVTGGGKRAVMLFGGELETLWQMRGLERFMMDMIESPEIVEAIIRHVTDFFCLRLRRALEVVGDKVDIVGFSGDLGSQRGLMFSLDMWRHFFKPQLAELMKVCHDAGTHSFYHSCGSIVPVIPDLIAAGVDILDPIQTMAEGMAPEILKGKFGDGLVFHGGVDEQELLPRGNPGEVRNEVRHLISTLGRKGGYILSSSHTLQPDTPPENIAAMFDAAREFSY